MLCLSFLVFLANMFFHAGEISEDHGISTASYLLSLLVPLVCAAAAAVLCFVTKRKLAWVMIIPLGIFCLWFIYAWCSYYDARFAGFILYPILAAISQVMLAGMAAMFVIQALQKRQGKVLLAILFLVFFLLNLGGMLFLDFLLDLGGMLDVLANGVPALLRQLLEPLGRLLFLLGYSLLCFGLIKPRTTRG